MPLANSMTCAGNLFGFNSGGYKNFISLFEYSSVIYKKQHYLHQEGALRELSRNVMVIPCQALLHPVLGINMLLLEQDHNLTPCGIRKKLDLIK